jgi:hypothetical protein
MRASGPASCSDPDRVIVDAIKVAQDLLRRAAVASATFA